MRSCETLQNAVGRVPLRPTCRTPALKRPRHDHGRPLRGKLLRLAYVDAATPVHAVVVPDGTNHAGRVEVILTALVNDPKVALAQSFFIRHDAIDLVQPHWLSRAVASPPLRSQRAPRGQGRARKSGDRARSRCQRWLLRGWTTGGRRCGILDGGSQRPARASAGWSVAIIRAVCLIPAALLCLLVTDTCAQTAAKPSRPAAAAKTEKLRQLNLTSKPWTGDFDKMLERRMIRVYAPYSRSLYFVDKGRERGLGRRTGPRLRALGQREVRQAARQAAADDLHRRGHARQAARRPARRPGRHRGRQPDRHRGAPQGRRFRRAATTSSSTSRSWSPGPRRLRSPPLDDLSGKTVHVRKTSSYYESLRR